MSATNPKANWSHLDDLEAEAIFILREAVAQFDRTGILFSGGKDSITLVHLAKKAFHPAKFPVPLVNIDTGHNFPETLTFRDNLAKNFGGTLVVRNVQDSIDQGRAVEEKGPTASRNALQTVTLLDTIAEFRFEALVGGARRDEEKARAKERIFSFRDEFGQWEPRNQRPELWNIFNGKIHPGQSMRVFPISNWTEMDVWQYIEREKIELPTIYFSHRRKVIRKRDGMLLAECAFNPPQPGDSVNELRVRCRTVGDMTCTGLVESAAASISDIIQELAVSESTERGLRADDQRSESHMEDRKRRGYF